MVYINEWLPDPIGKDAAGEWLELLNDASQTVSVAGWHLENSAGSKFFLKGTLSPGEYRVLPRAATKLTLKNRAERLRLFDAQNGLVHQAVFPGTAPEGQSVNRHSAGFLIGLPTPGRPNAPIPEMVAASSRQAARLTLASSVSAGELVGLSMGTGLAIAILTAVFIFRYYELRQLFFPRHQNNSPHAGGTVAEDKTTTPRDGFGA